jgi:hypothetical protein
MQRFRASGDPGEYGDWIVGLVHVPSDDEAGLRAALDDILAATDALLADREAVGDGVDAHYTLRMSPTGTWGDATHERDFWARAAAFPALHDDIAHYVEAVNADKYGWQDEYHPPGSFAVAELALADPCWGTLLGRQLFGWDMTCETWQETVVDRAFARHGFVDGTLDLLACRICADGQANDRNVGSALHVHGLADTLDLDDFARRCLRLQDPDREPDLGLEHFALAWADGDESRYDDAWAAFRRAGFDFEPMGFDEDESRDRAARRTDIGDGGWNDSFIEASVDAFDPAALEPL